MLDINPDIASEIYGFLSSIDMLNFRLAFKHISGDLIVNINTRELDLNEIEYMASKLLCYKLVSRHIRYKNIAKYRAEHAFRYLIRFTGTDCKSIRQSTELEPIFMYNPKYAYRYARYAIKKPWSEAESIIMTDQKYMYEYLYFFDKERVIESEHILTKQKYIYLYARNIAKERLLEHEHLLIDPEIVFMYARDVINGEFDENEHYLLSNPKLSFLYSRDIMKRAWVDAEDTILTDKNIAYYYVRDVIMGHWSRIGEILLNDSEYAYKYTKKILRTGWVEAEKAILCDVEFLFKYIIYVRSKRYNRVGLELNQVYVYWPEAEDVIATSAKYSYYHAMHNTEGIFEQGEDIIIQSPKFAYLYARDILQEAWPEAESVIYKNTFYKYRYLVDIIGLTNDEASKKINGEDANYDYEKFDINDYISIEKIDNEYDEFMDGDYKYDQDDYMYDDIHLDQTYSSGSCTMNVCNR